MLERSNVVIVSESLARVHFPNENPIGKRISIDMTDPVVPTEVIGVVGDVRFQDLTVEPRPTTYWPHPQLAYGAMTLTVRAAGDPLRLAPAVERAIRTLDPDQPVSDVRTMNQWAAKSMAQARFSSLLLAVFAGVALALGRPVAALLYSTSATDPLTFAGVAVVLSGVAFVASYLPARRASRVAPVEALRAQ